MLIDNNFYIITNDTFSNRLIHQLKTPWLIFREEIWKSHKIQWVKVNSVNEIELQHTRPRWIRVTLSVICIVPAIFAFLVALHIENTFSISPNFSDKAKDLKMYLNNQKANHYIQQFKPLAFNTEHLAAIQLNDNDLISKLPLDLLFYTIQLSIGDSLQQRFTLSQVSKKFYIVSNDVNKVWNHIFFPLGIQLKEEDFNQDRNNLIVRYRGLKQTANRFISLFDSNDDFLKLPIIQLPPKYMNIETIDGQLYEFMSLGPDDEYLMEKIKQYNKGKLISPNGCYGLFFQCKEDLNGMGLTDFPTQSWLIIYLHKVSDNSQKFRGNIIREYANQNGRNDHQQFVLITFGSSFNGDTKQEVKNFIKNQSITIRGGFQEVQMRNQNWNVSMDIPDHSILHINNN